jgi:hypothetical protein
MMMIIIVIIVIVMTMMMMMILMMLHVDNGPSDASIIIVLTHSLCTLFHKNNHIIWT